MKRILFACIIAAEVTVANAQLYTFPAPPMTVADCPTGKVWIMKNNLPTCDYPAPPPPPPPPPAPPQSPACSYQPNFYSIAIGDMGQCTADGGCQGTGYMIYYGGTIVAAEMWTDTWDWPSLNARANAAIAASGYSLGKFLGTSYSNGNNMGIGLYEVCR